MPITPSVRETRELNSVVVAESALHLVRHRANADVRIGHERAPPRSGTGIETATAWGSERGLSAGSNRRKPTVRSRLIL